MKSFGYKLISKKDLYLLLSHENFHNWTGEKIKPSDQGQGVAWWKEGFTDYYSRVLGLRTGDLSLPDFIDEVNQILRNYYLSPVRNAPNERIKIDCWDNKDVQKLPYQRGFVFAIYLNSLIKESTSGQCSLDNVMWDLFDEGHFSKDIFKKIVTKYIPEGIGSEIENYIENGETIDLSGVKELPLEDIKIESIDYGFTWAETITDIDSCSSAYGAGLRNGDKIKARLNGENWDFNYDPSCEILIQLKDERKIAFSPKKRDLAPCPQLILHNPSLEEKVTQWFGGKDRKDRIDSF